MGLEVVSRPQMLVIVPCGAAKIWDTSPQAGPVPACQAYTGTPFKLNRTYAERFGSEWVILSAKYGFLHPDDDLDGPYNVTFKRRSPPPISYVALREQVKVQGLGNFDQVIGFGGREYRAAIEQAFVASAARLHFPFAGLPLGKSLHAVKEAIVSGQPLPSTTNLS
jgi:hypothetical protein